jgi:hypothetical protein
MQETKRETIEIRDNRGHKRYFVDDVFDDIYAAFVGPFGYAVYGSLCRHANKKQKAWPGIDVMAKRLGMSRKSVFAALEVLEFFNIIKRERIGKKCNNRYSLLHDSKWRKDWEVMLLSVTSGEVTFRYFTSFPQKLQELLSDTSIVRFHKKGFTRKDIAAASAAVSPKCTHEGCGENAIDPEKSSIPNLKPFCRIHHSMTCREFVEWYRLSPRRYIKIVAEWADEVSPDCRTVAQWEAWASENFKASKKLEPFTDDQIAASIEKIKAQKHFETFNLETVMKYIVNSSK